MADQKGGELNSFPDLPPATAPADLDHAGRRRAGGQARRRARCASSGSRACSARTWTSAWRTTRWACASTRTTPDQVAAFAGATVAAYRRARVMAAVEHFPGPGVGDGLHRGVARHGRPLARRARAARPAPVPRGVPGRGAGRDAQPRVSTSPTTSASRARSRARSRPTCCAAESASRASRSPTTSPTRRSRRSARSRTPRSRPCARAPTCCTSPARRATSAPPTWPCCARCSRGRVAARTPGRGGPARPRRQTQLRPDWIARQLDAVVVEGRRLALVGEQLGGRGLGRSAVRVVAVPPAHRGDHARRAAPRRRRARRRRSRRGR